MSDLFGSKKALIAAGATLALVLIGGWFLLVSPQRSKADDLVQQVDAARATLSQRQDDAAASRSAGDHPGERWLSSSDGASEIGGHPGVIYDVQRLAAKHKLSFTSIKPEPTPVVGNGYTTTPVALEVQGRFSDLSSFLGELRSLVRVRHGRLDTRGRLYSVGGVDIGAPQVPRLPGRPGQGDAQCVRVQRPRQDGDHHDPVNPVERSVLERERGCRSEPLMAVTKDKTSSQQRRRASKRSSSRNRRRAPPRRLAIQGPKLWKQINPPAARAGVQPRQRPRRPTRHRPRRRRLATPSRPPSSQACRSRPPRGRAGPDRQACRLHPVQGEGSIRPAGHDDQSSSTPSPDSSRRRHSGGQPTEYDVAQLPRSPAGSDSTPRPHRRSRRSPRSKSTERPSRSAEGHVPRLDPDIRTGRPDHKGAKIGVAGGTIAGRRQSL